MKDMYKCIVCGAYVETSIHCGKEAKLLVDGKRRLMLSKLLSAILSGRIGSYTSGLLENI